MAFKRRSGNGGGHGGGGHDGAGAMRWLLTYADMITLLLIFFIVLYTMSRLDQNRYRQLVAALRMAFFNQGRGDVLMEMPPPTAPSSQANPLARAAAQEFLTGREETLLRGVKEELERAVREAGLVGKVEVGLSRVGLLVSFQDAVFFEPDRAELRPEGQEILRKMAPVFRRLSHHILVEGHTATPSPDRYTPLSHWELSSRRAVEVVNFLAGEGVAPERISAVGYGKWRPRYPNDREETRRKNRRVDIVILASALSPVDEAKDILPEPPKIQIGPAP